MDFEWPKFTFESDLKFSAKTPFARPWFNLELDYNVRNLMGKTV